MLNLKLFLIVFATRFNEFVLGHSTNEILLCQFIFGLLDLHELSLINSFTFNLRQSIPIFPLLEA